MGGRGNLGGLTLIAAAAADTIAAAVQIAAAAEVGLAEGAPAVRIKLLPIGPIAMRDNRGPFRIRDQAHADEIVAATRAWLGSADFNFDYDHQATFAVRPEIGGTAIAAGWCAANDIVAEADGIWANNVKWTPAAEAHLVAREYRYISPTFLAPPAGGDVVRLKNAALVNIGAIDLPAVAAGHSGEDDTMDLAAIAAALGLAATATVEEIAAAIQELNAKAGAIAIAAGLAATATAEEITAAVTQLKTGNPDPARFVPIEQVQGITQQLGVLNTERAEREVAAAIADGKLAPSMKAWGLDLFKTNEPKWNEYVKNAPAIVTAGTLLDDKIVTNFTTLTADEVAACEMTGTSHEDFLKAKNAQQKENG